MTRAYVWLGVIWSYPGAAGPSMGMMGPDMMGMMGSPMLGHMGHMGGMLGDHGGPGLDFGFGSFAGGQPSHPLLHALPVACPACLRFPRSSMRCVSPRPSRSPHGCNLLHMAHATI